MGADLPGMLQMQFAIMSGKFPHTSDAAVWAEEFVRACQKYPELPKDEGAMIGWFANAIQAGADRARYLDSVK